MNRRITDWLRSETPPRNLFELLGRPLLDSDREEMLRTLRASNRELLDYQGHPEPAVSKRAVELLMELGRSRGILEDPARFQTYIAELATTIREQFVAERGAKALHSGRELAMWLGLAYGVPSCDGDGLATAVLGSIPIRSRFNAFSKPVEPELVEEIAPPPAPAVPKAYDLFDAPPPSPRQPPRTRAPLELDPDEEPTEGGSSSSVLVPVAVVCGVLLVAAVVTAIVIGSDRDSEQSVRNGPSPLVVPRTDPVAQPAAVSEVLPKPSPSSTEPGKKTPPRKTPPKGESKPMAVPTEPLVAPKTLPQVGPAPTPPEPKRDDFDKRDWVEAEGGTKLDRVTDLFVRVHAVAYRKLTDSRTKELSPDEMLVIWVEVCNRGNQLFNSKTWMDWGGVTNATHYVESACRLLEDNEPVEKPYFVSLQRPEFAELGNWKDDRPLGPGAKIVMPVVFKKPLSGAKGAVRLELTATRLVGNGSKDTRYGRYVLWLSEADWKKAPPKP
jgi:hypothetical protein